MGQRAEVHVDLGAIASNIKKIRGNTEAEVLAVVKANAYGHGLIPVANCALESGATWLGVALLEEAFALREAGISAPLIAWLTPLGEDFSRAIELNIDLPLLIMPVRLNRQASRWERSLEFISNLIQEWAVAGSRKRILQNF